METILGLGENQLLKTLKDRGRDLFAAMGRQTVQNQRFLRRDLKKFIINLIAGKNLLPIRSLLFLAHTGPNIAI